MFITAPQVTDLSSNQPEAYPEHPEACPEHRWNYRVRVRGTGYLWGSAGVSNDASFPSSLLLHIRNDTFGEPITVGTQTADGQQTAFGTLQAGEQFSIPIQQISAVFATCNFESTITCWLRKS